MCVCVCVSSTYFRAHHKCFVNSHPPNPVHKQQEMQSATENYLSNTILFGSLMRLLRSWPWTLQLWHQSRHGKGWRDEESVSFFLACPVSRPVPKPKPPRTPVGKCKGTRKLKKQSLPRSGIGGFSLPVGRPKAAS